MKANAPPAGRRIKRWEHEAVIDAMQQRLDRDPSKMQVRRQTVDIRTGRSRPGWARRTS